MMYLTFNTQQFLQRLRSLHHKTKFYKNSTKAFNELKNVLSIVKYKLYI